MEVLEILFLIVMAWSIPNFNFYSWTCIFTTFLKSIDFFETIEKKDISEKETTNNKNSIGGDDYYWLQAPKVSYKLKINEEVKIPIEESTMEK